MAALESVCDEQAFILGARVADLEKDIQQYVGGTAITPAQSATWGVSASFPPRTSEGSETA